MTINLLGPISLKLDREGYRAAILTSGPCLLKLRKNGALHVGRSVHHLEYMIFIIFGIKTPPLRILIARGGDRRYGQCVM